MRTAATPWIRVLPLEDYLVWMRSKSYVGAIEPWALEEFMAAERESLLAAFPDGQIVEPFVTELYVVGPPTPPEVGRD